MPFYARRNAVISLLKTNIRETVFDDLEARIAAIDEQLVELQQQMLDNSDDNVLVEELGLRWMTFGETVRISLPRRQKGYTDNNIAFCLEAARIDNPKDVRFFVQIKCDRKIIKYDSRTMQIYSVTEGGKTQMKSLSNEINKEDFFDFYDSIMLQDKEWVAAIRGKNNFVVASFNDGYQSQIALDRILQLNDSR